MKPIRILHVIGSLNNGGSQAMIMNVYENINRSKVQFDFVIDRPDELAYAKRIKELGGKIFTIPQFTVKNLFKFIEAWRNFFSNHTEYKIIHGHVRSTASIYLRIARNYGLITIAHSHSTSSGSGTSAIAKNILQFPIRNTAHYFFACSRTAGVWLFGEHTCNQKNFFVISNAIDAKKFVINNEIRKDKRKELLIKEKFVIGHIGRFNTPKNHEFLIDIFNAVYNKNKNSVLLLVGDGDLKNSIIQKVNNLNISKQVIFAGVRSDIPELLQAMDVFVFPSFYEGLGMAAIEAQASGLPCIVSDSIPNEAIITDNIVKMSLNAEQDKWADNIIDFFKFQKSDTLEQIRKAGYDIKDTAQWFENKYLEIWGGKID